MFRMCRFFVFVLVLSSSGAASAAPEVTQNPGKPGDVGGVAAVMEAPWQWMPFAVLAALSIPALAFALQAVVGGHRLRSLARCIAAAAQQTTVQQGTAMLESSVREYSRLLGYIDTTKQASLPVGAGVSAAKLALAISLLGAAPLGEISAQIAQALTGTVVATSVFVGLVFASAWLSEGLDYLEEEVVKIRRQRLAAPQRGQIAAQRGQVHVHTESRQQRSNANIRAERKK